MALASFHPAVAAWFSQSLGEPTPCQLAAWPLIRRGEHALIAAPTGSGKTLAAFLAAIDDLVRQGLALGLPDTTQVVYVSPLKALSNDIRRNLEAPLAGIAAELRTAGLPCPEIRAQVRTGDTSQSERTAMRKRPPHILVTTPESLYLLLTSDSGRKMLSAVKTLIVDEIHAVAGSKRGAHLALTVERLAALSSYPLQRIGLSATQKPIEEVAGFLVGAGGGQGSDSRAASPDAPDAPDTPRAAPDCAIVDIGHVRERDLALELADAPLEAVMSTEVWNLVYDRLAALVEEHRTTLIFANTRRMVERVTRHLSERLGEGNVAAHHGSLAKEQRLDAEQRLKHGKLRALVATASLELGIDIGDVQLVCQLGTPRSIATFLQRTGRANHAVTGVPKGRLFPLSRDDLVECIALLDAVRRGELDRLHIPLQPLDVLAQQIVAEVAARDYGEEELFTLLRRAWPYRHLPRADFDAVLGMLADGFATRRGRQSAYLHRDAVNRRLRARRGAKLTAVTCGGAIADTADYQVILEPAGIFVGTLNEDFAIESIAGDIFQLGNASYRIQRVESGRVRVEDAKGQPPTIPFWLGEAPARTAELSAAVSRVRAEVDAELADAATGLTDVSPETVARCVRTFAAAHGLGTSAARQAVEYLATAKAVLGTLPTQDVLVYERFFDETGGMQLVIHAPFGGRINRAYGLALRKRFCRAFNFELQAAATEDAIVLSLGETHSFVLEEVARYLNSHSVRAVLIQAVLDAPMFTTRWRWNSSVALAVRRARAGKRTPAPLQRIASEDLIAVIFPDQLACAENLAGEREIPDHPLVRQTLHDCLHEAMDVDALIELLAAMERGEKRVVALDLPHPSVLAQEILGARPYAFLDDAPLEERRTQAVAARRWLDPQEAAQFGQLDPQAIALVREEAWPSIANEDELHDALMSMGSLRVDEDRHGAWQGHFGALIVAGRAALLEVEAESRMPSAPGAGAAGRTLKEGRSAGRQFWIAAERATLLAAIYPQAAVTPRLSAPAGYDRQWEFEAAVIELVRGRLQAIGPTTAAGLAQFLALPRAAVTSALLALEREGFVLRGDFTGGASRQGGTLEEPAGMAVAAPQETAGKASATWEGKRVEEWCERRLLARIHRYTIQRLRAEIEPVSSVDFMRFLLEWQGITREPRGEGPAALAAVIEQLEGFEVPAGAWESDVLPARLQNYDPQWLDTLCLSGRTMWLRLSAPKTISSGPVRSTPISLLTRKNRTLWQQLAAQAGPSQLSHSARAIVEYLQRQGASFFDEVVRASGLLQAQAEDGLAELVAAGLVNSDGFSGLRALLLPAERKRRMAARGRRIALFGLEDAGRWSLARQLSGEAHSAAAQEPASSIRVSQVPTVEQVAMTLLRRYGVVFRRVITQESATLPAWYEVLRAFRSLEAQGKIRGGRFVAGVPGEQYALPEAVSALRAIRKQAAQRQFVSLSAADPLNLCGILEPGQRVPAIASNRLLLCDGVVVATSVAGEISFSAPLDAAAEWSARKMLLHGNVVPAAARPI